MDKHGIDMIGNLLQFEVLIGVECLVFGLWRPLNQLHGCNPIPKSEVTQLSWCTVNKKMKTVWKVWKVSRNIHKLSFSHWKKNKTSQFSVGSIVALIELRDAGFAAPQVHLPHHSILRTHVEDIGFVLWEWEGHDLSQASSWTKWLQLRSRDPTCRLMYILIIHWWYMVIWLYTSL